MPKNISYLITGANRGIGRGLVAAFLARPHTTVIAAVRDPEATDSQSPTHLRFPEPSRLVVVVKIDSLEEDDARNALAHLESEQAISSIDVVIANAGTVKHLKTALRTPAEEMRLHFNVNTVAPLMLSQASWPLLQAAERPMFFRPFSERGQY